MSLLMVVWVPAFVPSQGLVLPKPETYTGTALPHALCCGEGSGSVSTGVGAGVS